MLRHACEGGEAGQQRGFVVTGTPGVGKSAFALFLLQQLGKQQQVVSYEYQDESTRRHVRLKFDFHDPGRLVALRTQLPLEVPDSEEVLHPDEPTTKSLATLAAMAQVAEVTVVCARVQRC